MAGVEPETSLNLISRDRVKSDCDSNLEEEKEIPIVLWKLRET